MAQANLSIQDYLKYINLQMAAESMFGVAHDALGDAYAVDGNGGRGSGPGVNKQEIDILTYGNNRSSKFTNTLFEQFRAEGWTVKKHLNNTASGFSATLFEKGGEMVLSFRSTEFIDDVIRDSKATNELQVRPHGWAFSQIDDMRAWVDTLSAQGVLGADKKVTVTGYSLGAHLAAAFNILYPELVTKTFTFNGAGVGTVNGKGRENLVKEDLLGVMLTFRAYSKTDANTDLLTHPDFMAWHDKCQSKFTNTASLDLYSSAEAHTP